MGELIKSFGNFISSGVFDECTGLDTLFQGGVDESESGFVGAKESLDCMKRRTFAVLHAGDSGGDLL